MFPIWHWVITFIGILAAILQFGLNVKIFYRHLLNTSTWKNYEFRFIVVRTVLDILQGVANFALFSVSIPVFLFGESFNYIFIAGIFVQNITIVRSFLAAAIAIERCWASIFPINFFHNRHNIPNLPVFILLMFTGLYDDIMLFFFCDLTFPLKSEGCGSFLCALPEKYWQHATIYSAIYCFLTYFFSVILCFKLLAMHFRKIGYSKHLKKMNLLCLTDGLSSLLFDFIPTYLFQTRTIIIWNYGPVTGVVRTIGRVFEAVVMHQLMRKHTSSNAMEGSPKIRNVTLS